MYQVKKIVIDSHLVIVDCFVYMLERAVKTAGLVSRFPVSGINTYDHTLLMA
jgi:hypothetical protein